jgi:hypothetical protein
MWRSLRISILLLILLAAGGSALLDRFQAAHWDDTLTIGIFPINADGRPATSAYLAGLDRQSFAPLEDFFAREALRYGVQRRAPVQVRLQSEVRELPPRLRPGSSAPARLWWSIKMRLYARRHGRGHAGQVRVFVLYHDPAVTSSVPHSSGLEKGLIGVVYAYAAHAAAGPNSVVIAHEILHTLGATDKYDPVTLQPLYPQGYAEPERNPRFPQSRAEIMAGRRALSEREAEMPDSLDETRVGAQTAHEIHWIEAAR